MLKKNKLMLMKLLKILLKIFMNLTLNWLFHYNI